ncbi:hypothetical protein [Nocardiopsis ganjiahuensis]|uniref:hypothetical protein n=1 Tax=Nocardiopsis ganjiahuensis TaxID=239984 RepID=UPI00034C6ADB|nr:hypothetical protein [Nocardiopsis ganjiahuensis]
MTESADFDKDAADIDDVYAEMDVGAPDQDTAVADYLEEHPDDYRIEEIEDHEVLGIDAELRKEVPEQAPDSEEESAPVPGREELARLLRAEEYAERAERRRRG